MGHRVHTFRKFEFVGDAFQLADEPRSRYGLTSRLGIKTIPPESRIYTDIVLEHDKRKSENYQYPTLLQAYNMSILLVCCTSVCGRQNVRALHYDTPQLYCFIYGTPLNVNANWYGKGHNFNRTAIFRWRGQY